MSKNTKLFANWKKYVKDLKNGQQRLSENMYNEMSQMSIDETDDGQPLASMDQVDQVNKSSLDAVKEPQGQSWAEIKPNDLQNAIIPLKGYLMTKDAPDEVWDALSQFMMAVKATGFK